jgi:predicted MarR family transcription regulator
MDITKDDIRRRLDSHPVTATQAESMARLRDSARAFGYVISELCPAGREKSLAVTELETALMRAVRAITHEEASP